MREICFETTSPLNVQKIHSPKFMHNPREGFYQSTIFYPFGNIVLHHDNVLIPSVSLV